MINYRATGTSGRVSHGGTLAAGMHPTTASEARSAVQAAPECQLNFIVKASQPIAVDVINDESLSGSSRSSSGPGFPRRDPGCSYCRCGYRAQCGFCPGYRCHSAPSSVRVSVTREGNQQEGRPYVIHPGFSSRHGIRKHGRERCLLLVDRSS